jgi:hypothetical protein
MVVCKLAILSFIFNEDLHGYDIGDLKDCIEFAQYELALGQEKGFYGQEWKHFIKWAKHKIKEIEKM